MIEQAHVVNVVPDTHIIIRGIRGVLPDQTIVEWIEYGRIQMHSSSQTRGEIFTIADRLGFQKTGLTSEQTQRMETLLFISHHITDVDGTHLDKRYVPKDGGDKKLVRVAMRTKSAIVTNDGDFDDPELRSSLSGVGVLVYSSFQFYMLYKDKFI